MASGYTFFGRFIMAIVSLCLALWMILLARDGLPRVGMLAACLLFSLSVIGSFHVLLTAPRKPKPDSDDNASEQSRSR